MTKDVGYRESAKPAPKSISELMLKVLNKFTIFCAALNDIEAYGTLKVILHNSFIIWERRANQKGIVTYYPASATRQSITLTFEWVPSRLSNYALSPPELDSIHTALTEQLRPTLEKKAITDRRILEELILP